MAGDAISNDYRIGGTPGIQYLDVTVFNDVPGTYPRFWPDDITNNGGTITWDYEPASFDDHSGGGNAAGVRADEAQSLAHAGAEQRMVYDAFTQAGLSPLDERLGAQVGVGTWVVGAP